MDDQLLKRFSDVLLDKSAPIHFRFRSLFTLRNFPDSPRAIEVIEAAVAAEHESYLLKHEAVYCLGQMHAKSSISLLTKLLADESEESMVRHEAAEALGVLGFQDRNIEEIVQRYKNDKDELVRDTCQLATQRIEWSRTCCEPESIEISSKFDSFDPTPPHPSRNIDELREILTSSGNLFNRYRAMMALRDIGSEESTKVLCDEMDKQYTDNALFRHELAFILGQLRGKCAIHALVRNISNVDQHYVVRHECAFALGSVAGSASGPSENEDKQVAVGTLQKYSGDPNRVVAESCLVGLDMMEYEASTKFQLSDQFLKECLAD